MAKKIKSNFNSKYWFLKTVLRRKNDMVYIDKFYASDINYNWLNNSVENCVNEGVLVGHNINEMFAFMMDRGITTLYMHDLDFEAELIVNKLLKDGFEYCSDINKYRHNCFNIMRNSSGRIYFIKIRFLTDSVNKICTNLEIRNSKCILPYRESKIFKDWIKKDSNISDSMLIKDLIDSNIEPFNGAVCLNSDEDLDDNTHLRVILTCIIMSIVIKNMRDSGINQLTIGKSAMDEWKKDTDMSLFPYISDAMDTKLRPGYRGGFTWINEKYLGKELGPGICLDVNGLYSYVMHEMPLPVGLPILCNSLPKNSLWMAKFRVNAVLKKDGIPCISYKVIKENLDDDIDDIHENKYLDKINDQHLVLTNFDWDLLINNYDLLAKPVLVWCYKFENKIGLFNKYIDHWFNIKLNSIGVKREISKLMLESLYGRFGMKRNRINKKPRLNSNNIVKFEFDESSKSYTSKSNVNYIPMSIFITSIGRWMVISMASKYKDRLVYIDTDGIHLTGWEIPNDFIISKNLGDFKVECKYNKIYFRGLKNYCYEDEDGSFHTKIAGAPEEVQHNITTFSEYINNPKDGFDGMTRILHLNGGAFKIATKHRIGGI